MDAPDLCVKCLLMDLRSKCCFGGPVTKKKKKKNHQVWSLEGTGKNDTRGRERERLRGRDRELGQTCSVLLGHSSANGLSARLKDTLGFKREPWRFFFSVYKPHLFIFMSLWFIYFLLSQHPLLCRWNHVRVTPSRVSFHLPPPCLLIPLQLKIKLL